MGKIRNKFLIVISILALYACSPYSLIIQTPYPLGKDVNGLESTNSDQLPEGKEMEAQLLQVSSSPTLPSDYPAPMTSTPRTRATQATPYPEPDEPTATSIPDQLATATSTPTTSEAYPQPGVSTSTVLPTLTYTPGSATPSGTISAPPGTVEITLTPTVVRWVLRPSDPSEFRLINDRPQLIVLYAWDWSPESRSLAPVLNALEGRYHNQIKFLFLEIDDPRNDLIVHLLGNRLPPVIYLVNSQGFVLDEWQGFVNIEELEGALIAAGG